jgi:predicted ATPase
LTNKLRKVRLVSLVAPDGVGKTRLDSRVPSDLAGAFRDGAWLVKLAAVREPGLVTNAALAALDQRDALADLSEAVPLRGQMHDLGDLTHG